VQIVVAGQGCAGLPPAVRAAEVGHRVVGYDVDAHRVQQLAAGQSYVEDVASDRLRAVPDSGGYSAAVDAAALAGFDIAVITVPTPLRDGVPDLTCIETRIGAGADPRKEVRAPPVSGHPAAEGESAPRTCGSR
jgi:UDP-N-acetyl-D-glucosamine dehydrogenase